MNDYSIIDAAYYSFLKIRVIVACADLEELKEKLSLVGLAYGAARPHHGIMGKPSSGIWGSPRGFPGLNIVIIS